MPQLPITVDVVKSAPRNADVLGVSPVLLELGCRERRLPAAPGTALPSTLPGATDRLHVLDGMRRATRWNCWATPPATTCPR